MLLKPPKEGALEVSWSDAQTSQPQLSPFYMKKQHLPPDVRTPYPISKAEPSHPFEVTYFCHLCSRSHSFWSLPKAHDYRWGVWTQINWKMKCFAFRLCSLFNTIVRSLVNNVLRSLNIMNKIRDKGQPCWESITHWKTHCLTLCLKHKHSSHFFAMSTKHM